MPGGWNSDRKIHFICHSLGAPTVRHLQYLLSIDYFNTDPTQTKVDKSDWLASMTTISAAFNGTTKVYSSGMNSKY
jgi:triacylglycerol esterase/lipase EstA (alpha/beta hydrolase family)